MSSSLNPFEWDWNWGLFFFYCLGVYLFGLVWGLIGLPGVFALVIAMVVGACAGSFDWFEAHEGNNDY
jgi:hypothetical protein